jgi:RNA polymerase sigma factor (sigma-70 family)
LESISQLIQRCMEGSRLSQKQLYELFAPKMFGVCLRYSNNREEAEEVLQEGFMQTFKSLNSFKHMGSFEGWIRKIMVRCAIQHYHSQSRMYPVINIEKSVLNETGTEDIVSQLSRKELLLMVQNLPPVYRMVFNLYVFEGMKHKEIAELLHISEGTSKSNLFDAKALLQRAVVNSLKVANKCQNE